jgi:molybdopterin-guanine dinucleotide biosynthesis protein A
MSPACHHRRVLSALVLAGGSGTRLGGVDKAALELGGRTLLARALEAVAGADEVVVVGDPHAAPAGVRFVREDPPYGGPAAGLLAGLAQLPEGPVAVLACDMAGVTAATFRRLGEAADGHDGAVLVDPDGRRQLALVLTARPAATAAPGGALWRLLAPLDLAEVAAVGLEHRDVDTWDDVRDLS